MNVSFNNPILTVKTGITPEVLEKANNKKLVAKDEKGNEVFVLNTSPFAEDAVITPFGITTNAVIDGELAVVKVLDTHYDLAVVKSLFGDSLINAKKYLPQIAAEVTARAEIIDSIFE